MGSFVQTLSTVPAPRRAIFAAAGAIATALMSNYLPGTINIFGVPILPGIYFGALLSALLHIWKVRSTFETLAVLVLTLVAWIAATRTAIYIHDHVMIYLREVAGSGNIREPNYLYALCGIIGGFVGSSITAFAISSVCKNFRTFENWARTIAVGTGAGVLLECYLRRASDDFSYYNDLPLHVESLLPLYLVWQSGIAACIAYGIHPVLRSRSSS